MMDSTKYKRNYFMPPAESLEWTKKEYIDKAPAWCSVDLRDGNQALIVPMSLDEKIDFFKMLVQVGFKEIEVGFPAASETEYDFLRALIDQNLIPDDVTVQVLTQARPHIIQKTFEAVKGCKHAVIHLYNSTSLAQREQVFKKSREEIKQIAVEGAKMLLDLTKQDGGNYQFEYSPESFTGTEVDYALEVCNAVIDVWQPTPDNKVIINLPATVEMSLPHVYASQIEYMSKNLAMRENVILSLHPHNDRGCGVADAELGVLAGADRIEGTLFGNGERTGNVDIITLAMNMYTHGIDPKLDFSDIPKITELYERVTGMRVYDRSPYTGKLVFAAFSGSHQDAIAKGMKWREQQNCEYWTVPYLPLDPQDVGRAYEADVIRINSQSGKGGIGYLMETRYGFNIPTAMRESFGYLVKGVSDHAHKELQPEEVLNIFTESYVNIETPVSLPEVHYVQKADGNITASVTISYDDRTEVVTADGNGRLDAVSNALKAYLRRDYALMTYTEHALEIRSSAKAVSYVGLQDGKNLYWGVGIHSDIIQSSIRALISALNRMLSEKK